MTRPSQRYHQRYYDRHALDWTRRKPDPFMLEGLFRRFLTTTKPGDTIIDIGCANGLHATMFAGIGHDRKYLGIDISSKFLAIARHRWPTMEFRQADIMDNTILTGQTFDAFWAASVFMHIPEKDWPALLENVRRITRPGSTGCITVPTALPANRAPDDHRLFTVMSSAKLRALLSHHGWRVRAMGLLPATASNRRWVLVQRTDRQ